MAMEVPSSTAPTRLARLFEPRGIAIAGASGDPTRAGGQALRALGAHGYRGGIFPVNPRYPELAGHRCHPDLASIDGECDLAVVALPAAQVPGIIRQCGRRGIPFAVVLGGGFREAGPEGARLEQDMLEAAHAHAVRIVGPNCLGLVNVHAGVYAAFGSITREPRLAAGGVSAVLQSGGFGNALVRQCAQAGVGFRHVVTTGNEADLTAAELIDAFVEDAQTRVILAYLEGVADGRTLMAAGRRALAAGKPVLVLKAGNTDQGRRAAASHTANLTGHYDVYRAAFRQCGMIEVGDIHEAADFALVLSAGRFPEGRNVALMGGSGGSAAVFADTADQVGLSIAPFVAETTAELEAALPPLASCGNPVDYGPGFPSPSSVQGYTRACKALLADPGIHQLGLLVASAGPGQVQLAAGELAQILPGTTKPVLAFSAMTDEPVPAGLAMLRQAGVPVLPSPRRVARAMAMLATYAEARTRASGAGWSAQGLYPTVVQPPIPPDALAALPRGPATLDEHAGKALLSSTGIPVSADVLLPIGSTGVDGLRYPVAVKIVSPDIAHKTEVGGVKLHVADAGQLAAAIREVTANARRARPAARLDGVLVSEMVTGVETIVGVVNDPGFGPVVAFGIGGIFAEAVDDMAFRVAPFGVDEARAMIGELRMRALFDGLRGQPPCSTEAIAAVLVQVSALAWQLRARLSELDINPLIAGPVHAVAADALVVLR
ncbi:MAG: acetate--CoA ligase family protein [bacterium]|jgi:acetyltransferase|nr:acetate--CoA ligase family protein [Betaproteobacteria bacterium]